MSRRHSQWDAEQHAAERFRNELHAEHKKAHAAEYAYNALVEAEQDKADALNAAGPPDNWPDNKEWPTFVALTPKRPEPELTDVERIARGKRAFEYVHSFSRTGSSYKQPTPDDGEQRSTLL